MKRIVALLGPVNKTSLNSFFAMDTMCWDMIGWCWIVLDGYSLCSNKFQEPSAGFALREAPDVDRSCLTARWSEMNRHSLQPQEYLEDRTSMCCNVELSTSQKARLKVESSKKLLKHVKTYIYFRKRVTEFFAHPVHLRASLHRSFSRKAFMLPVFADWTLKISTCTNR